MIGPDAIKSMVARASQTRLRARCHHCLRRRKCSLFVISPAVSLHVHLAWLRLKRRGACRISVARLLLSEASNARQGRFHDSVLPYCSKLTDYSPYVGLAGPPLNQCHLFRWAAKEHTFSDHSVHITATQAQLHIRVQTGASSFHLAPSLMLMPLVSRPWQSRNALTTTMYNLRVAFRCKGFLAITCSAIGRGGTGPL